MGDRALDVLAAVLEWLVSLPAPLMFALIAVVFLSPAWIPFVFRRFVSPRLRRRSGGRAYRRRNRAPLFLILFGGVATIGAVHLWATYSAGPLLIYGEGPVPDLTERIVYDLTVEPDGSLLVSEEMTLQLSRDPRSLFRPLRRDQPVTVLSLTDNDKPISSRVWVGPQYGIRMGRGTPSGRHVYNLTYRLEGATRDEISQPGRLNVPGVSVCLVEPCEDVPLQRVRWRPVTWTPAGEQVFRWHFPSDYSLGALKALDRTYLWSESSGVQVDARTMEFRKDFTGYRAMYGGQDQMPLPPGMTQARVPQEDLEPSLPVFVIPLLALVAVVAGRLYFGGRPRGLATLKAEYTSPDGLSAAQLGELTGVRAEVLTAATIADATSRGVLRVDHLLRRLPLLPDQEDDEFVVSGDTGVLPGPERRFIQGITHAQERMRFSQLDQRCSSFAATLEKDVHRSLTEMGYYNRRHELLRGLTWLLAAVLLIGGPYAMFFLGNQIPGLLPEGVAAVSFTEPAIIAWVVAAMIVAVYAWGFPTMTRKGAVARSRTFGFAEYLRTAELGPITYELHQGVASRYLPYAVALGLAPDLIERWRGLTHAPGEEEAGAGTYGPARFSDDDRVERRPLLVSASATSAVVKEGGVR